MRLPICMYVHHVCAVPREARRGSWSPLRDGMGAAMWVLGTEPSPLEEKQVLLTSEPSLKFRTKVL